MQTSTFAGLCLLIVCLGLTDAFSKYCTTCADCAAAECCVNTEVNINGPSGQYKQQPRGQCQPMGVQGSKCLVKNGSGKPHDIVDYACPCVTGLTCVRTGPLVNPFGAIGECRQDNAGYY